MSYLQLLDSSRPTVRKIFVLLADRSRRSSIAGEFVGCKILSFVHLIWNFFPGCFRHEVLKNNNQKLIKHCVSESG